MYQSNDSLLQVDDIAKRIDELYHEKVRLLYKIAPKNSMNNKDRYTKLFDVERARLIIADLPAAMRENNLDIVRYSLLRLLDKIEVDGENLFFHWSFVD